MIKMHTEATLDLTGFEKLRAGLKPGQVVEIGVFGSHKNDRTHGSEITNVEDAVLQEFGSVSQHIPARSFIRMPIQFKRAEILRFAGSKPIATLLLLGEQKKALKYIGVFCENIIQSAFDTSGFGQWAKNAPATVAAKGSSKPLIDWAELRKAVWSRVRG